MVSSLRFRKAWSRVLLLMSTTAMVVLGAGLAAGQSQRPPNIVFFLTDDQGWTETSVQMDPNIPESKSDFYQTPNLEALAAAGMRFSNAYSQPMCSQARAAIQTGKSPARLQMTDVLNGAASDAIRYDQMSMAGPLTPPVVRGFLPHEETTIAEWLDGNNTGYVTAHYGKWHLSKPTDGENATSPWYGYDYEHLNARPAWLTADQDPKNAFLEAYRANEFMQNRVAANQPFYLQVSFAQPHYPPEARPQTIEKYNNLPPGERHNSVMQAAMIEDVDAAMGQILDKINQLGIADNTYVVFAGDNGAHELISPNENSPLFQFKGDVYEGAVRVPMVVRGPGVAAGSVSSVPVMLQDMFATVSDIAGINSPLPANVESADLLPVWHNGGALPVGTPSLVREYAPNGEIFFHVPHYNGFTPQGQRKPASAVRDGDFKLVRVYGENGDPDKIMLFNLAANVMESNDVNSPLNLANSMPGKTAELLGKLDTWLLQVDATMPYDIRADYGLNWRASDPGADLKAWRSTNDVGSYFRERWEMPVAAANQPTLESVDAYQPGLASTAFHFDGNDSMNREFFRVSTKATTTGYDPIRSASVELWLRTDSLEQNQVLFESGDARAGMSITLGDADGNGVKNDLRFRILGVSGESLTATVPIDKFADPTKEFIQATAVFSDAATDRYAEIYINGALAARVNGLNGTTRTLVWDAQNLQWIGFSEAGLGGAGGALGANGGTGALPFAGSYRGDIAGVNFYNYALSPAMVQSNYNDALTPVWFGVMEANDSAVIPLQRPVDVSLGHAQSNALLVIQERNDQLQAPVAVNAVVTGSANVGNPSPGVLPQIATGAEFTSYLLHFDPTSNAPGVLETVMGSVMFDKPIIGLVYDGSVLSGSDAAFGSIGKYGAAADRGIVWHAGDFLTVSSDQQTLNFHLTTEGDKLLEFRVLTGSGSAVMLSGDFNHDGSVNGDDLAVWQNSLGVDAGGDADGDGDTDGADFLVWQQANGSTTIGGPPPVSSVPEPTGLALTLGLLAPVARSALRSRRRRD
jgi:arylsulfatase A-like enzyme